jgi:hypothetical protein
LVRHLCRLRWLRWLRFFSLALLVFRLSVHLFNRRFVPSCRYSFPECTAFSAVRMR